MQENVKAHRNSLLRKIIIIVFLPIIVIVWMMGWTLMQIEPRGRPTKIKQKTPNAALKFKAHEESEIPKLDEDSRMADEPQIVV